MNPAQNFLLVGLGGAVGACCRYAVSLLVARALLSFPLATLTVNVAGALAAGIVAGWFWHRGLFGTPLQLFAIVGFLGGFTTFSAFSVETLRLFEDGNQPLALLNIAANLCGSLLAVYIGASLARWWWAG